MNVQGNEQLVNVILAINQSLDLHKIYLFGSFVMDKQDEQSDLDLCIITNNLNGRKLDMLRKIRYSINDKVSMPIDLLLYTTEEFDERAKLSSTLEYQIAKKGVVVYES
jgi:predicted nucleotidyltransferase